MSEKIQDYFDEEIVQFEVAIQNLSFTNFRGFTGAEISFDPRLTAIIAKNGGGKTTILDGIWIGVRELASKMFNLPLEGYDLLSKDITELTNAAIVKANFLVNYSIEEEEDYTNENESAGIETEWYEYLNRKIRVNSSMNRGSKQAEIEILDSQIEGEESANEIGDLERIINYFNKYFRVSRDSIPVFKYYKPADIQIDAKKIYFQSLFSWVDKRQKIYGQGGDDMVKAQLELLNRVIKESLSEDSIEYDNLRILYYLYEEDKLVITKTETGNEREDRSSNLAMDQLSSGERTILSIFGDLVISLISNNPSFLGDKDPLENGRGIVLIDEVGVHLHPSWQRKIISKLTGLFPNIQFIITTHSPLILGEIDQSQGRLIKDFKLSPIGKVKGRDASSILEDEFGEEARPKEYQEKLDYFYRILKNNYDEAEGILAELKKIWPEDDEEIARAQSYLDIY